MFIIKSTSPPALSTILWILRVPNPWSSDLFFEEMKGNLTKLREEQMKSPLDDVDKLLKKKPQLEMYLDDIETNKDEKDILKDLFENDVG